MPPGLEWRRKMDNGIALRGIQYLVDSTGKRTAVVISLEEWGELWEDFYDVLVSEARKGEPVVEANHVSRHTEHEIHNTSHRGNG